MEHKIFKIFSIFTLIAIIISEIVYFTVPQTKYILKAIPLSLSLVQTGFYFVFYRPHPYAVLMGISFAFCLLGDILLMFDFSFSEEKLPILLLIGGTSFFVARVLMSLSFLIYPYINEKEIIIQPNIKKLVLMAILPCLYVVYFILFFTNKISFTDTVKNNVLSFLISGYILMMGIQQYISLLRIGSFSNESVLSQILSVIGTLLFNVSDSLLFVDLFIVSINEIVIMTFYWLGMYILTLSIVRNSNTNYEKSKDHSQMILFSTV